MGVEKAWFLPGLGFLGGSRPALRPAPPAALPFGGLRCGPGACSLVVLVGSLVLLVCSGVFLVRSGVFRCGSGAPRARGLSGFVASTPRRRWSHGA